MARRTCADCGASITKLNANRKRCLTCSPPRNRAAGELRAAFDRTVKACSLGPVDDALVAAGRKVADQIDTATAAGVGLEATKALYLMPHLVNILRELQATPAARKKVTVRKSSAPEAAEKPKEAPGGKGVKLRALQGGVRKPGTA
jgi:hypothetical protein